MLQNSAMNNAPQKWIIGPLKQLAFRCVGLPADAFANSLTTAITAALLTLLLLPAQNALADSFRCGTQVVRSGDEESALVKACGEPLRRDSAKERVGSGSSQKTVRVQRWYYKRSGRKLERVVMLYDGKIIAVRTGGR